MVWSGHCCPLRRQHDRGSQARVPAPPHSSGWRKPSERDLVIGSQGLRGSDSGVVWRMKDESGALETRLAANEIKNS